MPEYPSACERFKVMDLVRLRAGVLGPLVRTGCVVGVRPESGGYLVIHDSATEMGPFGWMEDELEPLPPWWVRAWEWLTARVRVRPSRLDADRNAEHPDGE